MRLVEAKFRANSPDWQGRPVMDKGTRSKPAWRAAAVDNGLGRRSRRRCPARGPSTADKAFASQSSIGLPAAAAASRRQDHSPRDKGTTASSSPEQPCLLCGRTPADPHHLRFAQPRALGERSATSSRSSLRLHHNELHRHGDEAAWWPESMSTPCRLRSRFGGARKSMGRASPAHGSSKRQAAAASTHIAGEDQTGV